MEILYKVHNNLYVNMTNKCPFACTFCLRQTMDRIGESDRLWLEREPDVNEVIAEFDKWNMEDFGEVVFCGFGEPTEVSPNFITFIVVILFNYFNRARKAA